jgi:enamine deaminase RidA (YjgF/YER057c/UK114 family)
VTTPHRVVNPAELAPPVGYAHAVVAAPGRLVFLGGQVAHDENGVCRGADVVEQFERAVANVAAALAAAGAAPEHLVSIQVFTTDLDAYRGALAALGAVYRRAFGRHYPALAVFEVAGLFDPDALVELVCVAVVPDAV